MEKTVEENNISSKRLTYCLGMGLLFLAGQVLLCLGQEILLDQLLCLVTLDISFFLIFMLALMKHRLLGELPQKQSASYQKVFLSVLPAWAVLLAGSFCPHFFTPVLLIGILLFPAMDDVLSLGLGLYMVLLLGITQSLSLYEIVCYSLLVICGILLTPYLQGREKTSFFGIHLLYFVLGFLLPIVFYYLSHHTLGIRQVLWGLGDGIAYAFVVLALVPWLLKKNQTELEGSYRLFLEDTYPLVMDIRRFSMAEYNHGRRVSRLAGICAGEIGADAPCAMMAGFYYRLGKMEGEPEIDNALRLANNHCFPTDVMAVMEEYGGILRLPQTPESAIVHMVDALVTKIELLDQDTMSSTWNQDMVIYQTLNELSQKGIYDESGISINQFLKIREKLVREDSLL